MTIGVAVGGATVGVAVAGACVAVAHQYLRAKGKEGYRFLPERVAREEQIREMSALGAQVIAFLRNP